MDAIIREFINGNRRMLAISRYFLTKELGGYGVVSMDTLDMCIKANWIRRWMNNIFERDYAECIMHMFTRRISGARYGKYKRTTFKRQCV